MRGSDGAACEGSKTPADDDNADALCSSTQAVPDTGGATQPRLRHPQQVQVGGSIQPLMASMLMSLVLAYLTDARDYHSIVRTSRALQMAAERYFVHAAVRYSTVTGRRRAPRLWHAVHPPLRLLMGKHRPYALLLDDLGTFDRRLDAMLEWRQGAFVAPAELRRARIAISHALAHGDGWGCLFNIRLDDVVPDGGGRDGAAARPLSRSVPLQQSTIAPAHLCITNSTYRSGYDSDGFVESLRYIADGLPFRVGTLFLFTALQTLTISQYDGALTNLLQLWRRAVAPCTGIMQLDALYLLSSRVKEEELLSVVALPTSPRRIVIDTPLEAAARVLPVASDDGASCRVQSMVLHSMDSVSRLPATSGLQYLRVGILQISDPGAWSTLTCAHLVSLHVDATDCDPHRASLDLDFSTWPHLRNAYIGRCASVTALIGVPSLVYLHLDGCTIHFRGVFVAEAATVRLVACVGASLLIKFRCATLTLQQCSGRPMLKDEPVA